MVRPCGSQRMIFPYNTFLLAIWAGKPFRFLGRGVEWMFFVLFVWGCFLNGLYWYLLQKCCEARLSSHRLYKFIYTNDGFHSGILQHIRSWRLSSKALFLFLPRGHCVGLTTAVHYKPGAWAKGWDFSWNWPWEVAGYQLNWPMEIGFGAPSWAPLAQLY